MTNFAEKIASLLAEKIEQGEIPWRKPAKCAPSIPCAGLERLTLNLRASARGFEDSRWYSNKAIEVEELTIKAGEKGISIAIKSAAESHNGSLESGIKDSYRILFNGDQLEGCIPDNRGKLQGAPELAQELNKEIEKLSGSVGGRFAAEIAAFTLACKYEKIEVPKLLSSADLISVSMHLRHNPEVLMQASSIAHLAANNAELNAFSAHRSNNEIKLQSLTVWRTDEMEYGFRANLANGDYRVCNMMTEDEFVGRLGINVATAAIDALDTRGVYNERSGRNTTSVHPSDVGAEQIAIPRASVEDMQADIARSATAFSDKTISVEELEMLCTETVSDSDIECLSANDVLQNAYSRV